MNLSDTSAVLERQLLLQLGERLKRLRLAQRISSIEMAKRVGISRTTLASVESGDSGTAMGIYLRVMSALGVSGDLALLVGDGLQPGPTTAAGARSKRARPIVEITVRADETLHRAQDLLSLALHEKAVQLAKSDPAYLSLAQDTLERWLGKGDSRSMALWTEWKDILHRAQWRRVLVRTRRAQELRQASPLTAVLPEQARQSVLDQMSRLKQGVLLSSVSDQAPQ